MTYNIMCRDKHAMMSTKPRGQDYSYQGPVDPMELGLELEDESLHGSLSQEEDMDMVPFGGSSEVRDVRRRRFFLVHFPSVGLILTSLAALAIGALIGTFASGTRGGGMGVDTDTPGDASAPVELPPNLAPGRSFDGAAGNATSAHPALSDLVQNGEIVGDVDWELDFAIVGFPKVSREERFSSLKVSSMYRYRYGTLSVYSRHTSLDSFITSYNLSLIICH
mmetsp:Transcript_5663/g.10735  ORF Transcript_5663/g.10735 Transcript_5663/m.10735 type:complete len:222 (-) Transcript_5663:1031-1696(-)